MEQLGFDAESSWPTRLLRCTPSRLTTWSDCPRRYRFTYLDRPSPQRGPGWAHNAVGAAAHLALARWWELPLVRRTGAAARSLLERAWSPDGFADDQQAHRWRGRTGDMVESYAASLDPEDEPRGIERTVAFRTEALAVSGRIDRVDQRGEELVVVDYKTGRSVLTEDDARGSLALALYALGVQRTFRAACTTVELHHLPTGRVLVWQHTPESLQRHLARATSIAAEVVQATEGPSADADEAFPTRAGPRCGWCDFVRVCPTGLQASGGPQRPWAGLAQEVTPLDEAS